MSLNEFLNRLRKRIFGRSALWQVRPAGRLRVVRLEERKLLDATAGFVGGMLTLDAFNAGDVLDISMGGTGLDFVLSGPTSNIWDSGAGSATGLSVNGSTLTLDMSQIASLTELSINPTSGNSIGNVTLSTALQLSGLVVKDAGHVSATELMNDFDSISISADSVEIHDVDDLEIAGLTTTANATITIDSGDLTDANGATVDVSGAAHFAASNITLGDDMGDSTNFGSLTLVANADVDLTEDSGTHFTGTSSIGGHLTLHSAGDITDDATADLTVGGTADLTADDVAGSARILLGDAADNDLHFGSLTLVADADVDLTEDSGTGFTGMSSIGGQLMLHSAGDITDDATADLTVGGTAVLTADSAGILLGDDTDNDLHFGSLTLVADADVNLTEDSGTGFTGMSSIGGQLMLHSADDISLNAGSLTSFGTVLLESAAGDIHLAGGSVSAAGQSVTLLAASGSVTGDVAAAIDITADSLVLTAGTGIGSVDALETAVSSLTFNNTSNATQVINTGALTIAGASAFGAGGGVIRAHSPLTVNATVTSGGDFVLQADGDATGNDTDDDLTINADVTHTGAAAAAKSIILRADDDVRFQSGTVSFSNAHAGDNLQVDADSSMVVNPDVNTTGDIDFAGGKIDLAAGTATLNTSGAIFDSTGTAATDVRATTVVATAVSLGASGVGNSVDMAVESLSVDTSAAGGSQWIHEVDGLTSISLNAGSGQIALAVDGSVLDTDADVDLSAGAVAVSAAGSVGSSAVGEAIQTAVDTLAVEATTAGGVFVAETDQANDADDDLKIGAVAGLSGISTADGAISLVTDAVGNGRLRLFEDVSAGDSGLMPSGTATLSLNAGGVIELHGVSLNTAGGDIQLSQQVELHAAGNQISTGAAVGGDITIDQAAGSIGGSHDLTIDAGTGSVSVSSLGATGALGALDISAGAGVTVSGDVVTSAAQDFRNAVQLSGNRSFTSGGGNITFHGDINHVGMTAVDLSVDAGAGNAVFTGKIGDSAGIRNIAVTGFDISLQNSVTTVNTGTLTLTNSGRLTISAAADMSLDGAFLQNGTGDISTAGDISTTADAITFDGAVTLTDDVSLAGAGITFASEIDGPHSLTIHDNGNALFSGNVGSATALTSLAVDAVNISVNADMTATGSLSLAAANDLDLNLTVTVRADSDSSGGDQLTLRADSDGDANGTGGALTMADGTVADGGSSMVGILADEDIQLSSVITTGLIEVTSSSGAIIDNSGGESPNLTADSLAIDAQNGIGSTDDIDTQVTTLAFRNSTAGDVQIANSGALTIGDTAGLMQSENLGGMVSLTATSPITFDHNTTSAGTLSARALETVPAVANTDHITVNGGVTVQSTGADVDFQAGDDVIVAAAATVQAATSLSLAAGVADNDNDGDISVSGSVVAGTTAQLQAHASGADLSLDGSITAGSGASLTADRDISLGAAAFVQTTAGPTVLTADAAAGANGGRILMTDGAIINGGSGTVLLHADGNIELGRIVTTNTTLAAVSVTSDNGQLTDGGDTGGVDIQAVGGRAVLTAAQGIGAANGLEVTLDSLDASVTSSGNLWLMETDAVDLVDVDTANGAITISAGGAVTATDVSSLTDADANDISLTSTSAGIDVVSIAAGAGSAADVILMAAAGSMTNSGGTQDVSADVLTMVAANGIDLDTKVNTINAMNSTSGSVIIDEVDALNLETIDNAGRNVDLATGGNVTDGGDVQVDLRAGTLTATIQGSFGAAGNLIETDVADLSVDTSAAGGSQYVSEFDGLTSIDLNAGSGDVVLTSGGAIADTDMAPDITAVTATLTTVGGIGDAVHAVQTSITTLNADNSTSGAVFVDETDDLLIGSVSNVGRTVEISADGSLNDAAADSVTDISATVIDLDAGTGIGQSAQLELASATVITADTTSGNIDLDHASMAGTDVSSLTTGNGTVRLDHTGSDLTVTGAVSTGTPPGGNGGAATLTSDQGLQIAATGSVSTAGGSGGSTSIIGSVVNGTVTTGAGNILLHGSGVDTIVDADISTSGALELRGLQDVIVRATLTTTGATSDISLFADSGSGPLSGDGIGGVHLDEASSVNDARLMAGGRVIIVGSDLVADGDGQSHGTPADTHQSIRVDADSVAGTTQIEAGGDILLAGASSTPAPDAPDIEINGHVTSTGSGTIQVTANHDIVFDGDAVNRDASLITSGGRVQLTAQTGALVDADSVREDDLVTAADLLIRAATGIGNFDSTVAGDETKDIDISVDKIAAVTSTGDIFVSDAGGLTVSTLPEGKGFLAGIQILSGASNDDILVRDLGAGNLTVEQSISSTGGGDVTLAAHGQSGTDSLQVAADITSNADGTTTSGDVRLVSEFHLNLAADVTVATKGGDAWLAAGADFQFGSLPGAGHANADLTLASGSVVSTVGSAGNALLTATNDVLLSTVNAGTVADNATVFVIADAGGGDGQGQILDQLTDADVEDESANITAARLALSAGDGIGVDVLNSQDNAEAADIDTSVGFVAATTDSGSIFLRNVNTTAAGLTVDTVAGVALTAAGSTMLTPADVSGITVRDDAGLGSDTADSGQDAIGVRAVSDGMSNGRIVIAQDVANHDAGNITISAEGISAADDLWIDAAVAATGTSTSVDGTTGGNIRLFAGDSVVIGTTAGRSVTTDGTGSVFVFGGSNRFSNSLGSADGDVLMFDGSSLTSTSGDIGIVAARHVQLSRLATAGDVAVRADSRMTVNGTTLTSVFNVDGTGTITDVLGGDGAGFENITANRLQLTAAGGIGSSADAIDTDVAEVSASTASGDVQLAESSAVTVSGSFGLMYSAAPGLLAGSVSSGLSITDTGAGGGTSDSTGDDIQLSAEGSITVSGGVQNDDGGNITLAAGSGGSLLIGQDIAVTGSDAMFDSDGNIVLTATDAVTMTDGTTVSTSTGLVTVSGENAVTISDVTTTGGEVRVQSAMGAILDADAGVTTDITADRISLQAATGIGGSGSAGAIETVADELAFDNTSGLVSIANAKDLTLTAVNSVVASANASGDVKLETTGNLVIDQNVTLSSGDLLLVVDGDVTQTAGTHIVAGGLGLMVTGETILENSNNNVGTLAAANGGRILYHDVDALTVGSVTVDGMSVTGITTTNAEVRLTVGDSLSIDDDVNVGTASLFLDVVTDVTQQSGDNLTAGALGLMVGGTTTLTDAGNNVAVFAAENGGITRYTDADDLTIGSVTVGTGSSSTTVTGVTTTGDDVRFTVGGFLAIDQAIDVTTAGLLLDVAGDVTQTAEISGTSLLLDVNGQTILADAGNDFDVLSADNEGTTEYVNAGDLEVGAVTVDGTAQSGITTSNDDVILCAASLTLATSVSIGTGTLRLSASNGTSTGSITQTGGTITAQQLGARADNGVSLTSNGNDVDTFAADGGTGSVSLVDTDGFSIGTVTASGCFGADVSGVTAAGDLTICVTSGDLVIATAINATGTVRLQADTGNVTQTASGAISAAGLGVVAGGNIDLDESSGNDINASFAARSTVAGDVQFADNAGFTVGSVTTSTCFAGVSGVSTFDGSILLTSDGGDVVNQAGMTAATTAPGDGNINVSTTTSGNVLLTGATTAGGDTVTITSAGNIDGGGLVTAATVDIDAVNGVGDTVEVNLAASAISVDNTSGPVNVNNALNSPVNVSSLTTQSGNLTFDQSGGGSVTFSMAATTTSGSIRLSNAAGGVVATSVTADTGSIDIDAVNGNVDAVSVSTSVGDITIDAINGNIDAGSVTTTSSGDIAIQATQGSIDAASVSAGTATAGDGNVVLTTVTNGDISVNHVAAVSDTLSVYSAGAINEAAASDMTADLTATAIELTAMTGIGSAGQLQLDAETLAATTVSGDVQLLDTTGGVTIGTVGGTVGFSNTAGSAADHLTLRANGDIVVDDVVAHSAAGNILLSGEGVGSQVTVNADVTSQGGHLTVMAADRIALGTGVTAQTSGSGTIHVAAANGTFVMADDAVVQSANGDIHASAQGDLTIGRIQTMADVALTSVAGSIVDADMAGDMLVDVVANGLRLHTAGSAGQQANHLETTVVRLSARSGSVGVFVTETDSASVTDVSAETQKVAGDGTTTAITDTLQSDLVAQADGHLVLVAKSGSIVLGDGTGPSDEISVSAAGAGNILLQALDAAGNISATADIDAGTGSVTLSAGNSVEIGDDLRTAGFGTVLVEALAGSVTLNDSADTDETGITTSAGDIFIRAATDVIAAAKIVSNQGNVGLDAGQTVSLNTAGMTTADVLTSGDVSISAGVDLTMSSAAMIDAGSAILVDVQNQMNLGLLKADHVALNATSGSILDNNGSAATNVRAMELRAAAGNSIGTAAGAAGLAVNDNALDLEVNTVAAAAVNGVWLRQQAVAGDIAVNDAVAVSIQVDVNRVATDGATINTDFDQTLTAMDDLSTTGGPIKLVAEDGSIHVHEGTIGATAGRGISANSAATGNGDLLLEARGTGSDVLIDAAVSSHGGHITVIAANDVVAGHDISTTGTGTLYVNATAGTITLTDADGNQAGLNSADGSILMRAGLDVSISADVQTSGSGDIGVVAGTTVVQNADVISGSGDVLVSAGTDITMAGTTTTSADGHNLLLQAGDNIALGLLVADRVSLDASTGSITDANGNAVTNVRSNNLRATAGDLIGGPDSPAMPNGPATNDAAIDTETDVLAASAANGLYFQQVDAGGALAIDAVGPLTVTVKVEQATFDSGLAVTSPMASVTLSELEDLTTTAGPIKVVTDNGTLTVNGGTATPETSLFAGADGDVLLESRGSGTDVVVNADVTSASGHISVRSAGAIDLNEDLRTGSVGANTGTIYLDAGGQLTIDDGGDADTHGLVTDGGNILIQAIGVDVHADIDTAGGSLAIDATNALAYAGEVSTSGGDILLQSGGDMTLDKFDAGTGTVQLEAGGRIIDGNDSAVTGTQNITASMLRMTSGQSIGGSDLMAAPAVNANALDISVDTVAATAATGIYLQEADGLAVDAVTPIAVNVQQVHFDSTDTTVSSSAATTDLSDLTTTSNGPIKLVTGSGDIVLHDGSDGDGRSVVAHGSGDILLEGRSGSNIVIMSNAAVRSDSGHVSLVGDTDIRLDSTVVTGGSGTVFVDAGRDIDSNAEVTTQTGDILLRAAGRFTQTARISSTDGDIGITAGGNIVQTATGDVTTVGGDVLMDAGADVVMDGTAEIRFGGQDLLMTAGGELTAGVLTGTNSAANRFALEAAGDILDGNAAGINIQETLSSASTSVSLRSGGSVGGGDPSSAAGTNLNALDLNVDTVAASAVNGVYLREVASGGDIQVDGVPAVTVDVDGVVRANFNSTVQSVGETRTLNVLEDLTTSAGPIKLVAENGTVTVNGGTLTGGTGILAGADGDVLLEARGLQSDVVIHAAVSSGTGHVTLDADDDVQVFHAISTGGAGTVYVVAGDKTAGDAPAADGISIDSAVTTISGDVLLESAEDVRQNAVVQSTDGDVGIIAGGNIVQTASGDVTTVGGDVLMDAGADWTMDASAEIEAGGGHVLGKAGADIALGTITLTNTVFNGIALSAGGNLTDANAAAINVQETVSSSGTSVSLRSGGVIGGTGGAVPADNDDALDLNVDTVAASAVNGIYLREFAGGGDIQVDGVPTVTVDVDGVVRANFNSTIQSVGETRTLSTLEDLTTTADGDVKLVAESGAIVVAGGTDTVGIVAGGTGNILLEARGSTDVTVNADVQSGSGHVTLNASDDVVVNASVGTAGDGTVFVTAADANAADATGSNVDGISVNGLVSAADGDVLLTSEQDILVTQSVSSSGSMGDIGLIAKRDVLQLDSGDLNAAGNVLVEAGRHWMMSADAVITATSGDVDGHAVDGDLTLGRIDSTHVALTAAQNVMDGNADLLNVSATTLSLRARNGLIGNPDTGNNAPAANVNAIDTQVATLAAASETGIYLLEADALVVDTVSDVTVSLTAPLRVNFNASTTDVSQSRSTSQLEDLTTRSNGPIKVVTAAGSLTVNGGLGGGGVAADGTGDVLLEARGTASDVSVNAATSSVTGNVTLFAQDDVSINAPVSTSATGTIFVRADNGTTDAALSSVDGIHSNATLTTVSGDILLRSASDIQQTAAIDSTSGQIAVLADKNILQQANGDITTGGDVLVEAGQNWTMDADTVITANGGELAGSAVVGDITVGKVVSTSVALSAGGSILDANADSQNITAASVSLRADSGTVGTNADAIDLDVDTLAANAETGIFAQDVDDLVIDTVAAVTVTQGTPTMPVAGDPLQVNFNSTTTAVAESRTIAELEDLTTDVNGPVKVVTRDGNLTVNGGTDLSGVAANGTGNVLLQAGGSGSVQVNDNVTSDQGHVTIDAADRVDLGDAASIGVQVSTGAAGTVVVTAHGDAVVMHPDAVVAAQNGSVHIDAATDIVVGRIQTQADVSVTATGGSITDADPDDMTEDIVARSLRLQAGTHVGDLTSNGLETRVDTLTAHSAGVVHINESDDLVLGTVSVATEHVDAGGTTTAVVDAAQAGISSGSSDVLLTTGGALIIDDALDASTADVRIVSGASITQTATGPMTADRLGIVLDTSSADQDISLGAATNSWKTVAVRNTSEGGDITLFDGDADGLVVGQVPALLTFDATTGINANAGNINVTSAQTLTVNQNIDAAHDSFTASRDESILLISRNGDFVLADHTVITSDENPAPGVFDDVTGDQLTIVAGSESGNGTVRLGDPATIEIRTDGGVAKRITPRPTAFAAAPVTGPETAFVTLGDAENMRSSLTFEGGGFLGTLDLFVGTPGEENLELVVDWGVVSQTSLTASGPAGDPTMSASMAGKMEFDLSDADKTIFYIDAGGEEYLVPHIYAITDLATTPADRNGREDNPNIIGVRFSVAQHESINIWGNSADVQGVPGPAGVETPPPFEFDGTTSTVVDASGTPVELQNSGLALLSSTDTNPLRQFPQRAAQGTIGPLTPTPTGIPVGKAEWEFIAGPSPGLVLVEPTERPTIDLPPVEAPIETVVFSEIADDVNFGSGAAGDAAIGTAVFLQIRRRYELDSDPEVVLARITDRSFISNREAFEQFVQENPELTDGAGYEVWLVTETDGQTVERPIVQFEITAGRPGPATEVLPDTFEPYRLEEVEFEQPEDTASPAAGRTPDEENAPQPESSDDNTSMLLPNVPADGATSVAHASTDAVLSDEHSVSGADRLQHSPSNDMQRMPADIADADEALIPASPANDGSELLDAGAAASGAVLFSASVARWRRDRAAKKACMSRTARTMRNLRRQAAVQPDAETDNATAELPESSQ